jgi:hypothetical protein
LIIPMFLSIPLLATPVKDTVWWDTPGGKVTERRDANGATCSLMLYNDDGSVFFEWAGGGRILVTVIDWNWEFPENSQMPVAMQLGSEWWSNGGDSAIIQGEGHGNAVSFALNKPIDDLLRTADHVLIRTKNAELSIKLNPAKTGVLLNHAGQCRDVVKR